MKQHTTGASAPLLRNGPADITISRPDSSVSQLQKARMSEKLDNSIVILAAITLGIPLFLIILLIGTNPSIQGGMLSTLTMFLVLSIFLTGAAFEIKRLADQPSDKSQH